MFDFRYHALSLVAVFLALGIGILLGVTIGDSLVSEADRGLRASLREDLEDARDAERDRNSELHRRDRLIEAALPLLLDRRLGRENVALVSFGSPPDGVESGARDAVEGAAGDVAWVAALPADARELGDAVGGRFRGGPKGRGEQRALGRRIGRAVIRADRVAERLQEELPDALTGDLVRPDAVAFAHALPEDAAQEIETVENAAVTEIRESGLPVVGVEESDADPSVVPFYEERGISSVDSVDLAGGRVALVFALQGAKGTFGFKDTAEEPLPEPPER